MTAITQITSNALHAATSTLPKNVANVVSHIPAQAVPQALPSITATTADIAPQALNQLEKLGQQPTMAGSLKIGKAILTLAAAALAFLFIGPLALKFAARSAGFLLKGSASAAKMLLSPQGLTKAAERGLIFFATLETALPFIKPLLSGTSISQHLVKLSGKVAQFGEQITQNAPRLAQMAGSVAGPEAGQAVQYIAGPQVTGLLQRMSQFLKKLAHNAPEITAQAAH